MYKKCLIVYSNIRSTKKGLDTAESPVSKTPLSCHGTICIITLSILMKEQTGNNNKYGKQSFGGGYHVWKNIIWYGNILKACSFSECSNSYPLNIHTHRYVLGAVNIKLHTW